MRQTIAILVGSLIFLGLQPHMVISQSVGDTYVYTLDVNSPISDDAQFYIAKSEIDFIGIDNLDPVYLTILDTNVPGTPTDPPDVVFPTELCPDSIKPNFWFPIYESESNVELLLKYSDMEISILDGSDAWGFYVDFKTLEAYGTQLAEHPDVWFGISVTENKTTVTFTFNTEVDGYFAKEEIWFEYDPSGFLVSLLYIKDVYYDSFAPTEIMGFQINSEVLEPNSSSTQRYRVDFPIQSLYVAIICIFIPYSCIRKHKIRS